MSGTAQQCVASSTSSAGEITKGVSARHRSTTLGQLGVSIRLDLPRAIVWRQSHSERWATLSGMSSVSFER